MRKRDTGFSLIELLIVVALVAIIVTLSAGGYGHVLNRTHRGDAMRALLRIAGTQERFYLENDRYAGSVSELGLANRSERSFYALSINVEGAASGYRAIASAIAEGRQASDLDCPVLTINATGARKPDNCWR